jgi:hypothetical protein
MKMQILSYGGGVQSVAMVVLAATDRLPRPDYIVCADTDREARSTWRYVSDTLMPFLSEHGMAAQFRVASHELATVDLYGKNGDLLLPAYTEKGKLPTFCSNEWKRRVIMRYLRSVGVQECSMWIGFSMDEADRVKHETEDGGWCKRAYPLLDLMLSRADCEAVIGQAGLPLPVKSACYMCPHRTNAEWRYIRDAFPDQWKEAIEIDEEIRAADEQGGVYLHKSRLPLSEADIEIDDSKEQGRQCALGFCFI